MRAITSLLCYWNPPSPLSSICPSRLCKIMINFKLDWRKKSHERCIATYWIFIAVQYDRFTVFFSCSHRHVTASNVKKKIRFGPLFLAVVLQVVPRALWSVARRTLEFPRCLKISHGYYEAANIHESWCQKEVFFAHSLSLLLVGKNDFKCYAKTWCQKLVSYVFVFVMDRGQCLWDKLVE